MKEIKKILILVFFFISSFAVANEYGVIDDDMQKQMQIASLKREISELEIQLGECKRNNKNWKTATYVGAAGTAITGVAAIAQGIKLNKLKNENGGANAKKSENKKSDEK